MFDERIRGWIESHRQQILDKWMDLVRIPSVRAEAEENAPYGVQCDRALRKAASYYEGFQVKVNRKYGYGCADLGTQGKLIALCGHSDVVPVGEGWLYTEPFEPVIKGDRLIGRGAFDNKSGVMASWCVLNILKDLDIPMNNRVRAFIGSNEESGMGDITGYVQNEEIPALSIVPDSHFPCSLGEKGILRMWAKSRLPLKDIEGFEGGSAFNTVLDKVTVTLKDGEGFVCEGVSKHAGSPDGSLNAAYLACKKLADTADGEMMAALAEVLDSPFGEGLGLTHTDEDFGRLTAVNGMVKVEDGCLCVSMDIRYGTAFDPKELERKLHSRWAELGFDITWMNNRPGFSVDKRSPVPEVMKSLFKQVTGLEAENYRMAGGTYSRYLPNAFTTGTAVHKACELEMPAGHGGAHQRDESISIEGFMEGVFYLTKAVIEIDKLI